MSIRSTWSILASALESALEINFISWDGGRWEGTIFTPLPVTSMIFTTLPVTASTKTTREGRLVQGDWLAEVISTTSDHAIHNLSQKIVPGELTLESLSLRQYATYCKFPLQVIIYSISLTGHHKNQHRKERSDTHQPEWAILAWGRGFEKRIKRWGCDTGLHLRL